MIDVIYHIQCDLDPQPIICNKFTITIQAISEESVF